MPGQDTELELKLRLLAPEAWAAVFASPALAAPATAPKDEHLETWYFDTADGYLQEAGLAYRIRLEGGRWTATVKADEAVGGGLHQRREWNVPVDEPNPSYAYFQGTEAGPLLADAGEGEPLVLRFSTIFDRLKADVVAADGSRIEVAVDRGTIFAGGHEEAIAEVELELKEGSPAAVLVLGAELVRQLPLAVESRSKYYRALVLAGLDNGADPLVRPPSAPEGAALTGVKNLIAGQLGVVFAAYEAFGADRRDAEALHRLRVQLRRLRSLLSLAKPLAEPQGYERWQQELGALSQATHSLREADVAALAWEELQASCPPLTPPPWLGLLLATEREKLAAGLDEALSKGSLAGSLLAFWAWLAEEGSLRPVDESLGDFAAGRLTGWLEELRAAGRDVDLRDVTGLHRLRIEGKRIRYVLESLPQDRRAKVLLARLKRLQDCLGQLHDCLLAGAAMDGWLSRHASRVVHRDAGLLVGWMTRRGVEAAAEFGPAWKRFKRAARRWEKEL